MWFGSAHFMQMSNSINDLSVVAVLTFPKKLLGYKTSYRFLFLLTDILNFIHGLFCYTNTSPK